MAPGDPVKYKGRHFVLVKVDSSGWATIRNDEGEDMRVPATMLSPA